MNNIKIIAGINLIVLIVYSCLIRLIFKMDGTKDAGLGIAIISAFAVGLQFLICLCISIIQFSTSNKQGGRSWLLSAGLVLLIGFSVCLGNASF